jgi:hypothetical protein
VPVGDSSAADPTPEPVEGAVPVTVVLRLEILAHAEEEEGSAYVAIARWSLPGVPRIGESIDIDALGHRWDLEEVRWRDGAVAVYSRPIRTAVRALELLEAGGWQVEPWTDEPPSDWLAGG